MICAKRKEYLVALILNAVFITASTNKEHNVGLRIVAEAGRIEEAPLRERENPGVHINGV